MTNTRRTLIACFCLTGLVLACKPGDEPATYLPRAGTWFYMDHVEIDRTCPADVMVMPGPTFMVDDVVDDTFQVEAGADDIMCEIDGVDFYCTSIELFSGEVPDLEVTITYESEWEGEFLSATEVEGKQTVTGTCTGDGCSIALVEDMYPCRIVSTFTGEFDG